MLYKDAANRKSNQKKSRYLVEFVYRDYGVYFKDEIAVCNLASLPVCLLTFNHDLFYTVTKRVTRNLNKVIDRNYYP
jgi:ribonucleoside-diphosphate reductase alpha chain